MPSLEHPEIAPVLRRLLWLASFWPRLDSFAPLMHRRLVSFLTRVTSPRAAFQVDETTQKIGPDGLLVRIFHPRGHDGLLPALLYLHGGGWTSGSSADFRPFTAMLAEESRCVVYSLDYRLAPEHPFPHALGDVATAWTWLLSHHSGAGSVPIIIGGDSAGGNLAAVFCRRLRDQGVAQPHGQFLLYPVTSSKQDTPSYQRYAQGLVLTRPMMDYFFGHYLGHAPDAAGSADVSPLHAADLSGLPPAFLGLAASDVLLDEGLAYAQAMRQANVAVEVQVYPDMIHGFLNLLAFAAPRASAKLCAHQLARLIQRTSDVP